MVNYSCDSCGKEFSQKSHYDSHKRRKKPCKKKLNKIELLESKVIELETKINKININSDDIIDNKLHVDLINININSDNIIDKKLHVDLNNINEKNKNTENNLYYKDDTISIYNNDCLKGIDNLINIGKKIELTITSPPYFNVKDYVEYENYQQYLLFLEQLFTKIFILTKPGRFCCVNISNILIKRKNRNSESIRIPLAFHFVSLMEKIKWQFIEDIQWIKPEGAAKNRNGGFFQHRQPVAYKPNIINEYILVFKKPSDKLIDQVVRSYNALDSFNSKVLGKYERSNVWRINPETRSKHPAPYPLTLSDKLVQYYSFVNDIILDPFMGSGTTALSCKKYNRKCIGFEIHSKYIDIFNERVKTIIPLTLETKICININEFKGLTDEEKKKKLNKYNKKFLISLYNNNSDIQYINQTKSILINVLCNKLLTFNT